MADKTQKVPQNVPGKWYVDETCTPCHTCMEEAANLLKYNEDETKVYFFKQPTTPEEEDAVPGLSLPGVRRVPPDEQAGEKGEW